ncbi:MAG: AAA family ATPase, partial [Nakamurella sp.]
MTLPDSLAETAPSEILFPDDPFDVRLALRASGLLRAFNDAAVITSADVHVAQRLARLGGEPNEAVLLAIALTVRGVRSGSVCVDLDQLRSQLSLVHPELPWPDPMSWLPAVAASPLVGAHRPLRFEYGLLYLDRYRRQEEQVRRDLLIREGLPPPVVNTSVLAAGLQRLLPGADAQQQRRAAEIAATQWTTVLGGGPGTGKTTTVARILALLLGQSPTPLRVAMAAPTGKAAARLQAAVQTEAGTFPTGDQHQLTTLTASTLHRLLGWVPGGGTRFRHNRDNRLPFDVVVVDETSMVSLTMMARLLEAVRPDARLILVGDPDQLASVEAGAVLADLVAGLTARAAQLAPVGAKRGDGGGVVLLRKTWRFSGAIAELAAAVRDGDSDAAIGVLSRAGSDVALVDHDDPGIRADVVGAASMVREAARSGDGAAALSRLELHRLLCAHRT